MKKTKLMTTIAALAAASTLALSGCATPDEDGAAPSQAQTTSDAPASSGQASGHGHAADDGQPPAGIKKAADPTYAVGEDVVLTADHMPGMKGAPATISGAFDTTAYSVS